MPVLKGQGHKRESKMSTGPVHDGLSQTKLSNAIHHKKLKDDVIYMLDSLSIHTRTRGAADSFVVLLAIWHIWGCVVRVVGKAPFLPSACKLFWADSSFCIWHRQSWGTLCWSTFPALAPQQLAIGWEGLPAAKRVLEPALCSRVLAVLVCTLWTGALQIVWAAQR